MIAYNLVSMKKFMGKRRLNMYATYAAYQGIYLQTVVIKLEQMKDKFGNQKIGIDI